MTETATVKTESKPTAQGRSASLLQGLADLDPVSEDLILEILTTLEKQAWMIRSQLAE